MTRYWMLSAAALASVALSSSISSRAQAEPRLDLSLPGYSLQSRPVPQHLRLSALAADDQEEGEEAVEGAKERETFHQLDVRYRRLSVPDAVLDVFYQLHEHVSGQAVGADYTTVKTSGFNIILSADYSEVTAPDGPWQEKGEGKDIDWTELNLFFISGDITVAYEVHLPGPLSVVFGTGLGFGYVGGSIVTYDGETGPTGARTEEDYPTILPVVNVQVSPRVVLFNKLVLQADVGLRNALYGGLSAGLRF